MPGVFLKMNRSHLLICFTLALWLVVSVHARAQSARIAVMGDSSLSDLIDLTTAELSKSPDLTVLERADLAKLGQEQTLQTAINSNALPPIQFIPADGLIILRAVKQPDGKSGVFARLIAVQPGIVLREVALPSADDPAAQVKALSREFSSYWPKLMAIQKGKITALSLLGLRFEVDAPDTREMERRINILLASRLSTEPDTVVLERWRLNDAVFEKALVGEPSSPFWTGSSLVDGSMKFSDNTVAVTVHVRSPHGSDISISDSAAVDQLPALIGRLADKIQAHPGAQGAWQPAAEADHFASLGKWCLDNRLYDEGAGAIESALALGDTSRTTHMLQIRSYALLAYPDELQDIGGGYGIGLGAVDQASIPDRARAGTEAANLTCAYLDANRDFSSSQSDLQDPAQLSLSVLNNLLRTLRLAYDKGNPRAHADDIATLRHATQKLMARMEQSPPKNAADGSDYFLKYKIDYAAFWHDTPEATLAYYRELLGDKANGAMIRKEMFQQAFPILHRPYLDSEMDLPGAPAWDIGSPWVISWEDESAGELKTLWQNFLKEKTSSPDFVSQADEIKFEFSCTQTRPGQDALGARFMAFIQQHQDMLSGLRGDEFAAGLYPALMWAARNPDTNSRNALRGMIEAQLRAHTKLPADWISPFSILFYYRDKSDEAEDFRQVLDDYCKWYQTQIPQNPAVADALARTQKAFFDPMAESSLKNMLGSFLQVHAHWPSAAGIEESNSPGSDIQVDSRTFMVAENKIWFVAMENPYRPAEVMCIDPSSLQTVATFSIPKELTRLSASVRAGISLDVSPEWLAVGINGRALVGSRINNQWRALDVPPSSYKPRWVNHELYLLYDYNPMYQNYTSGVSGAGTAVSGLIHVSLPTGDIDNLVSSRRIPPQTALDGKPLGYALDLWSSPNLTLAFDADSPRFRVFSTPQGKNDWKPVASDASACEVKLETQGTLIGKGFDDHSFAQLVLMDAAGSHLLLSNPARATPGSADAPAWDCPQDFSKAEAGEISQNSPALRGNDLCLYHNVLNGTGDGYHACLYYFADGQKTGLKIPLAFSVAGMTNPGLIRIQSAIYSYQSVVATDYGLVIGQVMHGFWVIPWKDIDAYRARLASSAPPSGAVSSASGAAASGGSPGGN